MKNYTSDVTNNSTSIISNSVLDQAHGSLKYKLTNDYLFRAVFQKNTYVLKGLICSLLNIKESEIQSVVIENPIVLGEAIDERTVILDLKILLNNMQKLNIEMQVANRQDWTDRSLFYSCRSFCDLKHGENYKHTLPFIHISILDFTLFPDRPEFYAKYYLCNVKNHLQYSDKFAIYVLNLKQIRLASKEDISSGLSYWARLFSAASWEDIKMLAKANSYIREAAVTMRELSEDEKIKLQCEARLRYEMDQEVLFSNGLEQGILQGKEQQKQADSILISRKDKEILKLKKQLNELLHNNN